MHSVVHTETTLSSIKSTVSQASSGYICVTSKEKQRPAIKDVYPPEPPPDYDNFPKESSPQLCIQTSPRSVSERSESTFNDASFESSVPLLVTQHHSRDDIRHSIVRISSHDLNIEIVSQSPNGDHERSPFSYNSGEKKKSTKQRCRKLSKREKIFVAVIIVIVLALILVIVNFTACIGNFTSAC